MDAPAVSVILVSWNTRELLSACLLSLRPQVEQTGSDVWVADNASADSSADMVARDHPWVHLIRNDANVGFARACNAACRQAKGRYLFFFNPDATLDPGSLAAMLHVMEKHPEVGALMPRLLDASGRPTHFVGRAPRLVAARLRIQRALAWRFGRIPAVQRYWERASRAYLSHSQMTGLFDRPKMEGAALFVRREAWDQQGGFDPSFFCGYEETDLTLRMRRAGWRLALTPDASVRHHDQQSRIQWKSRPWEAPDGYYYFRKHNGRLGLLKHHWAEWRRLRRHSEAGEDATALWAERQRAFAALWRSPKHPGYH